MSTQMYCEVKRKATVGERIKILSVHNVGLCVGEELTVMRVDAQGDVWSVRERAFAGLISYSSSRYGIEYVVLEPVASTTLESDPLYAAFCQFVADNAAEIRAILPEVESALVTEAPAQLAPVTPKLTRAQVIAKATADVAELESALGVGNGRKYGVSGPNSTRSLSIETHVNRNKRAVTVLLRGKGTGLVRAKHTAKCSPADVFHAEIGKAIALRKALGLTVPSEYTDAPQPEEPRVGAVVYSNSSLGIVTLVKVARGGVYNTADKTLELDTFAILSGTKILDDTDVDYGAEEAKGAAA